MPAPTMHHTNCSPSDQNDCLERGSGGAGATRLDWTHLVIIHLHWAPRWLPRGELDHPPSPGRLVPPPLESPPRLGGLAEPPPIGGQEPVSLPIRELVPLSNGGLELPPNGGLDHPPPPIGGRVLPTPFGS